MKERFLLKVFVSEKFFLSFTHSRLPMLEESHSLQHCGWISLSGCGDKLCLPHILTNLVALMNAASM